MNRDDGLTRRCLPAEWYPQSAVQLTWPHAGTDWATAGYEDVVRCFVEVAHAIIRHEMLLIVCRDAEEVRRQLGDVDEQQIIFREMDTNDTWARDHGGITILENNQPKVCDFVFNGWGMKYAAHFDNLITRRLFTMNSFAAGVERLAMQPFVLEGGSIESDGQGTLITTTSCLTAPNRNEHLDIAQIEEHLKRFFGARRVLWLTHGILVGDDTDGHVDTLVRFCDTRTIAYVQCINADDIHFAPLAAMEEELKSWRTLTGRPYRLIPLPMPRPVMQDGRRLPATYANFLIINDAILMPLYLTDTDDVAKTALQRAFPTYEITGINSLPLIRQYGSLHCMAMQYPANTVTR
jgi:agmatine/peptidylarginine deiminase